MTDQAMKLRTGKECKKVNCKNYEFYSHWFQNMPSGVLSECMECKNAHVSQYARKKDGSKR